MPLSYQARTLIQICLYAIIAGFTIGGFVGIVEKRLLAYEEDKCVVTIPPIDTILNYHEYVRNTLCEVVFVCFMFAATSLIVVRWANMIWVPMDIDVIFVLAAIIVCFVTVMIMLACASDYLVYHAF
jgi:hypothetical protein